VGTKKIELLSQNKTIRILKKELPFLRDKYGVERIAIFGSFAKGKQGRKSDIDILVDLRKPLGLDFVELADRLEEKLGKKVDIATFDCYRRSFNNPRYKHIAEDIKKNLIYV
jgi:hypothetical protein